MTTSSFPDHNIDPRKKNKEWHLKFCKAAWNDCENQPRNMFYHNAANYDEIKSYALGRQSTERYKKPMHVDEQSNTTFAVLDFKVLPILKKHRQIALGRLQKSDYNFVVTPIDALAKTQADMAYAQIKAKILLRNQLLKVNPELAESPLLKPDGREPLDLEELEMQMEYGFKHNMAMECEQGIQLIFDQNNITECRLKVIEDLFDFGVAVYKDWMEPDGKVRFRRCDVRSIITNYCRYDDFSDMLWCGEAVDMTWMDFREQSSGQFNEDDYEQIFEKSKRSNKGNYEYKSNVDSKFKVKVLDLEWFSDDEYVYEDKPNKYGNPVFTKTEFKNKAKAGAVVKKRKNIYRAKWVVGTEYIYDYGMMPYMKRNKGLTNTKLSFHIVATNFHDMTASGIMSDLIPIADQMAISWLKLQNIRNELKPYFIDIDLDAIEDVNLGKGGESMTPKELLKMWSQKGIMLSRRKGLSQNNPNYKSIEFVATNYGSAIAEAWNDFNNFLSLLREATGFNEVTDGSTPNPKNLNSTNAAAIEGTNNALYHISSAEKNILKKLAEAVLCRMRRAVKMGKVEGYIQALGFNTIKFIQVSPDIDLHEYGLMIEDKPNIEAKQMLQLQISKGMQEGLVDPTDAFVVQSAWNLKQAEQILAYRIKKRRELKDQQAQIMQQQNGQIQIQSAQAAEQMKQQTLQLEAQLEMQKIQLEKDLELRNLQVELEVKYGMNKDQIKGKQDLKKMEMGQPVEQEQIETPLIQE
jgi:hypothetical protein